MMPYLAISAAFFFCGYHLYKAEWVVLSMFFYLAGAAVLALMVFIISSDDMN